MATYESTEAYIDFSRLPLPQLIEEIDYEAIRTRYWDDVIGKNPKLSNARPLEQSPANMILGAQAYGEMLLRSRINAAARSVLAPFAKGSDLDAVAARMGIHRLTLVPASADVPAVMETDDQFLRRYILSFDRPSAGSADRYLFEAYTACPDMHDVTVVGRSIHGRRGDVDVVVSGVNGADPTPEHIARISAAVNASHVKPEATNVTVLKAVRFEYAVHLGIYIPRGPDATLIRSEAESRIWAAANDRKFIGSEVPLTLIDGSAYGPSVVRVERFAPEHDLEGDPYAIPICTSVTVDVEVMV